MRIGFTLYISRGYGVAAVRGASSRAIFVSAVFETRNENKRDEYVPVIYARGARCSSLIYRFTPPRTPSVAPGDAHDAPRYRHTGMDCVFVSASEPLYMLITIVCSTIRLKCTFINRIHRGYLSGCRTISP